MIADSEQEFVQKLNKWKDGLEKKGMKVNISKIAGGHSIECITYTSHLFAFSMFLHFLTLTFYLLT